MKFESLQENDKNSMHKLKRSLCPSEKWPISSLKYENLALSLIVMLMVTSRPSSLVHNRLVMLMIVNLWDILNKLTWEVNEAWKVIIYPDSSLLYLHRLSKVVLELTSEDSHRLKKTQADEHKHIPASLYQCDKNLTKPLLTLLRLKS